MVCCVSPIPAACFPGPHSESAILRNSEVFEDHNTVGTFHMYTMSNHWKILSRELKLCELCLRKISLGKLYSRPCSKKKCWQLIAALVCCYICSDRGIEGLNQALQMRLPRNDFKVLSQSRWKNDVIN